MLVLLLCSQSAADMALGLVDVENHPRLRRQARIDMNQTVCDIFMYCGLTDSKPLCRLPHGRVFVDDIIGYLDRKSVV